MLAIPLDRLRSGAVNVIVSVSGGKDSAACALLMRELEIQCSYVFADTGWESQETYSYLRGPLSGALGTIHEVRADVAVQPERLWMVDEVEAVLGISPSPMVRRCIVKAMFPSRKIKWCTTDLKVAPLRAFHQQAMRDGRTVVSVVGLRRDESARRASTEEWEIEPGLDAISWRPLAAWSVDDVIAIHARHGLRPNPLYLRGMARVGCWPCVNACKAEYAEIGRADRARVDALRLLERHVGDLQAELGRIGEGRTRPTWCFGDGRPGAVLPMMPPIDTVMEWAATDHGGRQTMMLDGPDDAGCMRWGLCEPPEVSP